MTEKKKVNFTLSTLVWGTALVAAIPAGLIGSGLYLLNPDVGVFLGIFTFIWLFSGILDKISS